MNKLHIGSTQYTNPTVEQSTEESVGTYQSPVNQNPVNPNISFSGGSVKWTGGQK